MRGVCLWDLNVHFKKRLAQTFAGSKAGVNANINAVTPNLAMGATKQSWSTIN